MSNIIYVINGPNLNFLGSREPEIYGYLTYEQLCYKIEQKYKNKVNFIFLQTNYEGKIIDTIQKAYLNKKCIGIICNPAAYSHYSIAIADCYRMKNKMICEVHLSNYKTREKYRQISISSQYANFEFFGEGIESYFKGVEAILNEANSLSR